MIAGIALRYLIAKKSHGAVATITTVSVCAMAVATAAIVCVLSVFNGFKSMISDRLDTLTPDIIVTPAEGKVFPDAESLAQELSKDEGIEVATPTLTDNALLLYNSMELPVEIKGVEGESYGKVTQISRLVEPELGQYHGNKATQKDANGATIAIGVASRLSAIPGESLLLFAPRREGRFNAANPLSSFTTDSVTIAGIYRTDESQYDDNGLLIPLSMARQLLQYDTEASAIEIKGKAGSNPEAIAERLQRKLGDKFLVRDRMRQQEMNFRMVKIEKWVSYMLLGFILIIAGFNIISSLSMLVLEKEQHLSTFAAMGMSRRRIGGIFAWESIYVAAAGGLGGILLGVVLCLAQEHFHLIEITNTFDPTKSIPYPVALHWFDLFATLLPILLIGAVTALISARFAMARISK